MKREEAIEQFACKTLLQLSENERADQLHVMMSESWDICTESSLLPKEIIDEFESGDLKDSPYSQKYDQVLMIWLREELKGVTNSFLCEQLNISLIEGEPAQLFSCPCCGSRTIDETGCFEICKVCWWEDDGQDNDSADRIGGPNYHISLTQGRYNFLKSGIYDPERKDLLAIKDPMSKYEQGREFAIDGEYIIEKNTNWKAKYISSDM